MTNVKEGSDAEPVTWPLIALPGRNREQDHARRKVHSASRRGDSPRWAQVRVADSTACAAYAPLASPACAAPPPPWSGQKPDEGAGGGPGGVALTMAECRPARGRWWG